MKKPLTESQQQNILDTYQRTKSVRLTSDELNIDQQRIRYLLNRHGIPLTKFHKTRCYDNYDLVVRLAQEGVSYSEIARRVGTNHSRVKDFLDRYNIEHPGHIQTGANNPNWRGGRVVDKDGYVLIHFRTHPSIDRHGYVREHRLVMEKKIGRYLTAEEVVHHIDGNYQNNEPDNLEMFSSNSAHLAKTLKGKTPNWSDDGWQQILKGVSLSADRRRTANRQKSELDGAQ